MPDTRHQPALWLDEVPTFEIIDGVGHCTMRSGGVAYEMCFSLSTMAAGVARASAAFGAHSKRPDNVVPLCELCIRHDLPRDTH